MPSLVGSEMCIRDRQSTWGDFSIRALIIIQSRKRKRRSTLSNRKYLSISSSTKNYLHQPNILLMEPERENPQLIKLNVDILTNRRSSAMWFGFSFLILIVYLLTYALPAAFIEKVDSKYACAPSERSGLSICQPFHLYTNPTFYGELADLSNMNQFLVMEATPIKRMNMPENLEGVTLRLNYTFGFMEKKDKEDLTFDSFTIVTNHSLLINCYKDKDDCSTRFIFYEPQINYDHYVFMIRFFNTELVNTTLRDIDFKFWYVNAEYSLFLLLTKYMCFGISIIAFILYACRISKIGYESRVFEQRYLNWLGLALLLFNDPTYAMTILNPNIGNAVLSTMFIFTFYCLLILFWICQYERIYVENDRKSTKCLRWWKILTAVVSFDNLSI
eukprot:TRINITY_DN12362_c0_g1_i11.p2 TRINITY_DN12362_c0_g1~~TRINITY_DN12362_c0_g1_i11.p2  ORF type:complete len:388 (+),score=97.55 TRINITY_DN12362_c0_g1_i11:103-1266(+)